MVGVSSVGVAGEIHANSTQRGFPNDATAIEGPLFARVFRITPACWRQKLHRLLICRKDLLYIDDLAVRYIVITKKSKVCRYIPSLLIEKRRTQDERTILGFLSFDKLNINNNNQSQENPPISSDRTLSAE